MTILAFDMSSYLKTALLAGKDLIDGKRVMFEDEEVLVNTAAYGYENVVNMMLHTMRDVRLQPKDCLLVFEGMKSKSRRLMFDATYKAKRDKRPSEFYEEFICLRDYIESEWRAMGAISIKQDCVEGDDTLAWLAQETEDDLIIATRDGDLSALNTEPGQTNAYGATVQIWNDGMLAIPKADGDLFIHPCKYLTLYKALVGDKSDNVPGVKGFGKAKFQKLAEAFGYDGLDELVGMLDNGDLGPIHGLAETDKLVKMIVVDEKSAITSWRLVKMYPGWINTMQNPVAIGAGKVEELNPQRDSRLHEYFGKTRLVTADNYAEALEFFKGTMTDEVTFDIETSTPPESDDWLAAQGSPDGVDQIGSFLVGFSFTFGANMQYTFYVSVKHAETDNISMHAARHFIEHAFGKAIVIQNTAFELAVLANAVDEDGTPWTEHWSEAGAQGYLPGALDTKFEASYVDENRKLGLKERSQHHLGYTQTTFAEVTTLNGLASDLPPGGKLFIAGPDGWESRKYKMDELTAQHVMAYGADDTICTSALHNYYRLVMKLEHTWKVYLAVEIKAAYQHAKNFNDGMTFSLQTCKALEKIDKETYDKAWATVRGFLMGHEWLGTVPPTYGPDILASQIKEAYRIVKGYSDEQDDEEEITDVESEEGEESSDYHADPSPAGDSARPVDEFLSSRVRTPAKLRDLLLSLGEETFAGMLAAVLNGNDNGETFTSWVRQHFSGEPIFKMGNKQMCKLLYDEMKLPVRVRGKVTKIMKTKGLLVGNPKADALAIEYAMRDATEAQTAVLDSLKLMQMVKTRRGLYYDKYPYFIHWKTGRIHPSHNQSQTNTRRASEMKPNKQQLPKSTKISGQPARFRETIIPHKPGAVIVSLDEDSQELRLIADYSRDANMLACYIGDDKKDMHALTGYSIVMKKHKELDWSLETFTKAAKDKTFANHLVAKDYRALGKKVNFTTEFGAMAPKLALTMLVSEDEAQDYINAKEKTFPGVRAWKNAVIAEAKRCGIVRTKEGAVRHLAEAFKSEEFWIQSKAERQSVNFEIQSSAAEMIKKAEGRVWDLELTHKYDAVCYGPVHDELVFSVMADDLVEFIKEAHWCMVQPYGGMIVPIVSSISFGPNFGVQVEIGSEPTAEAVARGWVELKSMGY